MPTDFQVITRLRAQCRTGEARKIRLRAQASLADVGQASGDVPAATIHRWETGQRRPTGQAALRYAKVLDELRRARPALPITDPTTPQSAS